VRPGEAGSAAFWVGALRADLCPCGRGRPALPCGVVSCAGVARPGGCQLVEQPLPQSGGAITSTSAPYDAAASAVFDGPMGMSTVVQPGLAGSLPGAASG
jgi:hypothetical protein